jgi:hypothetical protein
VALPAGAKTLTIQARDEAGNLGFPASFGVGVGPGPGEPGGPGGTPGLTGSGPATTCQDRLAPRSAITRRSVRASASRLALAGGTSDRGCLARGKGRVARVYVAVYRPVAHGCRWLTARGRLTGRRPCRRPVLLRVTGTTRWRFAKRVHLPRGRYGLWVLGEDAGGNRERGSSSARRASFRLR